MNENSYSYLFLSVLANLCQLDSWNMNKQSLQNEDLLKYLEHQDNDYFNKLVKQNDEIIKLCKKIVNLLEK